MDGADSSNSVRSPRLCSMSRGPQGYGFNLHGEKGIVGQFISAVDKGGPADLAGLCVGDRVVAVNHDNVEELSHAAVVTKIKQNPDHTVLLVVDKVTDEYLHRIGVPITEDLVQHDSVLVLTQNNDGEDEFGSSEQEGLTQHHQEDREENHNVVDHEITHETAHYNHHQQEEEQQPSSTELRRSNHHAEIENDVANLHLTREDHTQSMLESTANDHTRNGNGGDDVDHSRRTSFPGERMSQSSESDSHSQTGDSTNSGRLSADSAKLAKAAASRQKPRRKQIKEDKSESWASKAALFNNL